MSLDRSASLSAPARGPRARRLLLCASRFSAAGVHAQTAAMRPELFHVERPEAVTFEDTLDRHQGEIGKVFMIDRVELVFRNQPAQMREFERQYTIVLQRVPLGPPQNR